MQDVRGSDTVVLGNRSFSMRLDAASGDILLDDTVEVRSKAGKTAADMRDLLFDKTIPEAMRLYDFFVGLEAKADRDVIAASKLRYDLIIAYPGKVGREFVKTSGHEHIGPYPEIYEVLHGTALFVMQKGTGDNLEHFAALRAGVGDKILVPPGYAHATVNIGAAPLVFADLVMDACKNEYGVVKRNHGMGYYVLDDADNPVFEKNPNYRDHPPVKRLSPSERPELGLTRSETVYDVLVTRPDTFAYLADPEPRMKDISYLAAEIE